MNFLNNISIKLKLLMMAVPPLLIITFHSVLAINALFTEKENLQVTKSRILEVESLAKAIHFLQIERGLSVGFITTNGAKNGDELTDVRNKVDNALNEIKEIYAKTKGNSSVLNNLSELNQKRSSVDSLKISAPDVGAYYTKNIVTFIDAAAIIPTQMNDKDGRNTIQAYTHLASAKESLGQIRALLNQAFNLNSINATNYSLIIGREIVYDVNNRKFETLAPKELQDFYKNNFKGEAVDKTFSMIETAKNKGLEGNFGVDATVWFTNVTASIDILRNVELELYKFVYKAMDEKMDSLSVKITTALALVIFFILAGIVVSIVLTKNILNPLNSIRMGLTSFFKFLNRETTKAELINLNSKDEFGEMAKVINENISSIEKGLLADANTVANAVDTANKVKAGYLNVQINVVPNNPQLVELRNVLNEMLVGLNANIEKSLNTLKVYATNNFTSRADKASLEGEVASLIDGINNLGNEISTMLSSSLTNGLELQTEASTLKQSVELLLTSSNQQAASLEETAAAMEEMTSNVQNNVAKSNDMALMATQTDSAAREGAVLASRTASAMTEIQSATNSINDAVAIIENIAFQTNILSLNAAVEAATAGDAGKGFAVVAQEVRNLANRSADAAKEIKAMASQAAHKSNEGMNIATELTRGFEVIADKIAQTASMVQDVSNANREQMQGIGQINTAVTQLDQMTQENAKVAAQADAIANATISKAQAMVQDALSKEFVGKNNIRATATRTNAKPVQAAKPVVVKQKYASNAIAKNSSKHESDVWESF